MKFLFGDVLNLNFPLFCKAEHVLVYTALLRNSEFAKNWSQNSEQNS
ncbi:TPA: hypothetical protein I7261_05945 [Vibrio parahaemolyticus]|nr:hypothetical protein [Vibrio parahaemolyticus]